MADKNAPPETIYSRQQIRNFVKDAVNRIGGKVAFQFIGPAMRLTVIQAECWSIIRVAPSDMKIGFTGAQIAKFEQAMCEEAGIWGENPHE